MNRSESDIPATASSVSIRCGEPGFEQVFVHYLRSLGVTVERASGTSLILDEPRGFALDFLDSISEGERGPVLVVTWNRRPEHMQDLHDLSPGGLVSGDYVHRNLVQAIEAVSRGERCELARPIRTPLNMRQRAALQCVARGLSAEQIAARLGLQRQSAGNLVHEAYERLGWNHPDHAQVALYYWGLYSAIRHGEAP